MKLCGREIMSIYASEVESDAPSDPTRRFPGYGCFLSDHRALQISWTGPYHRPATLRRQKETGSRKPKGK